MSSAKKLTGYELLAAKAKSLECRYNRSYKQKNYLLQWMADTDTRTTQINKLTNLVSNIDLILSRWSQLDKFTDSFNLSALRGCYYSLLLEIRETYKNQTKFTNSDLVQLMMEDLEISKLPVNEHMKKDIDKYKLAKEMIRVRNSRMASMSI